MSVIVHLPAILSRFVDGAGRVVVAGDTVGAVLAAVESAHPDLGRRIREAVDAPNPFVAVYLNDEDVRFLGGRDAAVRQGDELSIVSAVAGG